MITVYLFLAFITLRQLYRIFFAPKCFFCHSILEHGYCYKDCIENPNIEHVWCQPKVPRAGFIYHLKDDITMHVIVYPHKTVIEKIIEGVYNPLNDNYWNTILTLPGNPLSPQNVHRKLKLYLLLS